MIRINQNQLIEMLLQCGPIHPWAPRSWEIDHQGNPFIVPGMGGITLNAGVGDSAFGWEGDHIEPSVSCMGTSDSSKRYENPNLSLQVFGCCGNEAVLISGAAKGKKGYVIGHHGGAEHLIVEFPKAVKVKMTYDDKIMIRSIGQGLKLLDHPSIHVQNLDPHLLKKMRIKDLRGGKLEVPVTTIVPAECMGSGIGSLHFKHGDYDVMTSDEDAVRKYKIDKMRFGDFVAIKDHDTRYGAALRRGAVSIGIVIHSDSFLAGHGPGITMLMTSPKSDIVPRLDSKANIKELFQARR